MMRKPPRWCHGFVDRHGKARWYFRRRGFRRVALPGLPWSPEFMRAYEAALSNMPSVIGAARTRPGSVSALVVAYYASSAFKQLAPSSQSTVRNRLERFRFDHGDRLIAELRREDVKRLLDARADRPIVANNLRKTLRLLMQFAVDRGWRKDDPTVGVKRLRVRSEGFRTWNEDEIAAFEARWPIGTRERLAFALLLYTAQRRSDIVRMGRQHLRDGRLYVRQQKTGAEVDVPLHPALEPILAAVRDNMTFVVTDAGKPFTPASFTNWFRGAVADAGLPKGLSPHGLRKAACRRLAEVGCTPHAIMAISGHRNLKEVARYTEAAERASLARDAIAAVHRRFGGGR